MNLIKYLIFIFPLLVLSCKDQEKSSYLEEVKVMSSKLDSLSNTAKDQTSDSIRQVVKTIEETINKVKENYIADTIDLDLAAMMNSYKDVQKVLSSNTGNLAKAKDAIPQVKEKLEHLKHDIENGVGNREKYEEYMNFEKGKIQEIESILKYYIDTNTEYLKKFKTVHPKVKNFADSLEVKNAE